MNALLDRRADRPDSPTAFLESNGPSGTCNNRSRRATPAYPPVRRTETTGRFKASSMLLQTSERLASTVFAGVLLCVSVGFSILLVAAMLVVVLCGLACYS
jgi:hypothetical protein